METYQLWNVNFLNQILDTMAEGLFTMDNHGTITSWNKSMEKITGFTEQEALGNTCSLIECSQCFGKACPADIKKCGVIKHGKTEAKECFVRHKDGYDVAVIKNARLARDDNDQILGIVETITDLTELKKIKKKAEDAQKKLKKAHRLGNIIGKSAVMQNVFDAIRAASNSHATVLIQGESGTGKELVADAIHYNSAGSSNPLITVNCSALSETLLESELFGHVKGAFSGAIRDKKGRFELADGGSIFLDEVAELPKILQVKLLRFLQDGIIEKVGGEKTISVNVRVISATNKDLKKEVLKNRFREDLFYRLNVIPIHIPLLCERKTDIPILVNFFLDQAVNEGEKKKKFSNEALSVLMDYNWPGNVRELQNTVLFSIVKCRGNVIKPEDLPLELKTSKNIIQKRGPVGKLDIDTVNKALIETGGNKAKTARLLGVGRATLYRFFNANSKYFKDD